MFTLGDNAYDSGSPAEFRDCYDPTWGRVKDRTELPVAGNHDYGTPNAAGYRDYFGKQATPRRRDLVLARHRRLARRRPGRELHRDRRRLRPGLPAAPVARARTCAQSDARCTLAMWHQPRFSSGEHGNDPTVAPFWNVALRRRRGPHPQRPRPRLRAVRAAGPERQPGQATSGIVEIVVGTGGGEMRDVGPPVAQLDRAPGAGCWA